MNFPRSQFRPWSHFTKSGGPGFGFGPGCNGRHNWIVSACSLLKAVERHSKEEKKNFYFSRCVHYRFMADIVPPK